MDKEPPLMFYCKECKTMLNERCFYDPHTGNLNSICTMCSLLRSKKRTSPRLHQSKKVKQRSSDSCSLERCNRNSIYSPPNSMTIGDCRNVNCQQSIQLNEPVYVAKLIYHPCVKECSSHFFPSSDCLSRYSFESAYSTESNSDVNRSCSFDNSRE